MITKDKRPYPGYAGSGEHQCNGEDGYQLANIKDEIKNKEMHDYVICIYTQGRKITRKTQFWVGGTTEDVTKGADGWAWSDGSLLKNTYANWNVFYPK